MASKIEKLESEIAEMQSVVDDPSTPTDIKKPLEEAIVAAKKQLAKASESAPASSKASPLSLTKKKKAAPALKKISVKAKSYTPGSLKKRCAELAKKYTANKEATAERAEKRRDQGKPAVMTPAETIRKTASAVQSKVVTMVKEDKKLDKQDSESLSNGIIKTVQGILKGFKSAVNQKAFLSGLISDLQKMERKLPKAAMRGMQVDSGCGCMEFGGEVNGFKLKHEVWSKAMGGNGISGTIRTCPENYYVATIDEKGDISFNDIESMTKDVDKKLVKQLWESGQIKPDKKQSTEYAEGGSIEDQNNEMLVSKLKEVDHHADELKHLINSGTKVESWVVARVTRAATDLADVTHYIDGEQSKVSMAEGGTTESRVDSQMQKLKEEGRLKRYFDVRGNGTKYFETIIPNKKELGFYKRYESLSKGDIGTLQNEYLDESDVRKYIERSMPNKEYAKGGSLSSDNHKYYIKAYNTEADYKNKVANITDKNKMSWDEAKSKQEKLEQSEGGYYCVDILSHKDNRVVSHSSPIMKHGGTLAHDYGNKTPKEVWDSWDAEQRKHFIADHFGETLAESLNEKDLDREGSEFYDAVKEHMDEGRYAEGGRVSKSEKEKLSNLAYQLQNVDEAWIAKNHSGFVKMQNDYKAQFRKVYGHSNYEDPNNYAKGGGIADVKLSNIRKNRMGTASFDLQISSMRKPQDFVVYPIEKGDKKVIQIQSDTRIGHLDLETGKGIMSQSHSSGAYFHHLQMDNTIKFELTVSQNKELKDFIVGTSGEAVGERGVLSDNSGASELKRGGSTSRYNTGISWHEDRARHNKGEAYEVPLSQRKMEQGGDTDYMAGKEFGVSEINGSWYVVDKETDQPVPSTNMAQLNKFDSSEKADRALERFKDRISDISKIEYMAKGGRFNTGRSWHQDHNRHNKNENYEVPASERKEGGGKVDSPYKFNYMMLGRLQGDCEYYLGNGNKNPKHLWAGSVDAQISEMKRLWNQFPEDKKPEWLSMDQIDEYEKNMKDENYINNFAKGGRISMEDWAETISDKLIKHYLGDGVEGDLVFSDSELRNEGSFLIDNGTSGNGSKQVYLNIYFGNQFDKANEEINSDYEKFASFADSIASEKGYSLYIGTIEEDQVIVFTFTKQKRNYEAGGEVNHKKVYISESRNKFVIIDVSTNNKWANEYFKDHQEAEDFIKQNNLELVSKQSKPIAKRLTVKKGKRISKK